MGEYKARRAAVVPEADECSPLLCSSAPFQLSQPNLFARFMLTERGSNAKGTTKINGRLCGLTVRYT